MRLNDRGFGVIEVLLIVVVVGILGFVGYRAYSVYTSNPETGDAESRKFEKKDTEEEETKATEEEESTEPVATKPAASVNTVKVADYTFTLPSGWKSAGSAEKVGNRTILTLVPNSNYWVSESAYNANPKYSSDAKIRQVQLYVDSATKTKNGKPVFWIDEIVQSSGSSTVSGKTVKHYEHGDGFNGNYDITYTFAVNLGNTQVGVDYMEYGRDSKKTNKQAISSFRQQLHEIAASYRK